jgi:outer membrane protein OmpA-like peptidoglycan-associated protein
VKNLTRFFTFLFVLTSLASCVTTGRNTDTTRRIKFTDSPDGARATMNDSILFAVNSSELFKQSDELFDALKPVLLRSNCKITVEGHTDSTGTDDYNLKLSQRRAEAVKDALIVRQVAPYRIEALGYGASRPVIADAQTPQELAQNRRAVETVESIGGSNIEKTLSDISNKIHSWLGTLFKKDAAATIKN